MVIIEKLTAEFEIKLAAELVDALSDVLALQLYILVIGKTDSQTPLRKIILQRSPILCYKNSLF